MKKIKRFVCLLLLTCFCFSSIAYASGDPNMGGGGIGGWGNVQGESLWNPGYDGVRVTAVDALTGAVKSISIDYTNINAENIIEMHFGKICKTSYRNGTSINQSSIVYECKHPVPALPTIIEGDISTIRKYFTDKGILEMIAKDIGISYNNLIGGNYKLLIEPIAYCKFQGIYLALTATEAALFDKALGSQQLRIALRPCTHLNLPHAIYLEKDDLGYKAKDVQRTMNSAGQPYYADNDIIEYMGIGIVSFEPTNVGVPEPGNPGTSPAPIKTTAQYNANTTVYTTIPFYNDTEAAYLGEFGSSIDEVFFTDSYYGGDDWGSKYWIDSNTRESIGANVNFKVISGSGSVLVNRTVSVACPINKQTPAYISWKTPSTEQEVTIIITVTQGKLVVGSQKSREVRITAKISKLKEVTPPDPKVNDPEPNMTYYSPTNVLQSVSGYVTSNKTSLSWKEWKCTWTRSGSKAYVKGFDEKTYSVSMSAEAKITPAKECPTATYSNSTGKYTMKSGYGFEITVTNHLSGSGLFACTSAQHANTLFPEFNYKTYNRLLEKSGGSFVFKTNEYSTYDSRVHFTPIRFRDNRYYNVYAEIFDVWCPAGSLSQKLTDSIYIKGNVYDDWHIAPVKP